MEAFLLYLIPLGFFLFFFGVQYGVNRLTKRLWVRLIPAVVAVIPTAVIFIAVETGSITGSGPVDFSKVVPMIVFIWASLPALLGAGIGALVSQGKGKKPGEKDGEAIER